MNQEQLVFAESPIQNAKLLGSPGCGKTTTIIEYVIDKNLTKNQFFILTFSKQAQIDFVNKGKSKDKIFTDKNVRTLHSLSFEIYKRLTKTTSKFLSTLILSTKIYIEKDPSVVADLYKNIKVIIIDEAQDISKTQYEFANTLTNAIGCSLILVGDPSQNIYQFQGGSDRFLLEHPGKEYRLMTNYRSSNEIIDFLNQIRPHRLEELMTSGRGESSTKPIIFNGEPGDIEAFIVSKIKEIQEQGIDLSEIAIIGSMKKSKSEYAALGLSFASHALHDAGIDFIQHYSDGKEGIEKKSDKESGKVNLLTCHASKGLEFHTTIVINYHLATFSRRPTKEDYYQHCYLWYVGLSRAKNNLIICVNKKKEINPQISMVNQLHYEVKGSPIRLTSIDKTKFGADNKTEMHNVTEVITDLKYFNEEVLLKIQSENLFTEEHMQEEHDDFLDMYDLPELDPKNAMLYGVIMEFMFQYEFFRLKNNIGHFVQSLCNYMESIIVLTYEYNIAVDQLKGKGILDSINSVGYSSCQSHKSRCGGTELTVINKILRHIDVLSRNKDINRESIRASVIVNNNSQDFDKAILIEMANSILETTNTREAYDIIFDIGKYIYAYENEKRFMNSLDYESQREDLFQYYVNIENSALEFDNLKFGVYTKHPLMPLQGIMDAVHDSEIIELKFANEISESHKMQCLLYMACSGMESALIVNTKNMDKIRLRINPEKKWKMHEIIASALGEKMARKMIILDLETNSKVKSDKFPIISKDSIEIIDHHIYELATRSVVSTGLVKNQWKITNAHIHGIEDASDGISKDKFRNMMKSLGHCYLMAHNGIGFDFKVLEHLDCLPANASLIDSMNVLRSFVKLRGHGDVKLESMYRTFIDKDYVQTHRAKEDVEMIIALLNHFKIGHESILCMQ